MLSDILRGDALHAVDFNLNVGPIREGVGHLERSELVGIGASDGHAYLIDGLLVHLHAVNGEPWACV